MSAESCQERSGSAVGLGCYADAIGLADSSIRIIRQSCAPRLLSSAESFLQLDAALAEVSSRLETTSPPEPILTNYVSRLQTLAFELRRARMLLERERSRMQRQS